MRTWVIVLLFLLAARLISASDVIHGCGGFVEAGKNLATARRPSDPKPDYSHIAVELQTLDGLVKDRVQCAPNGYYFLPVYDKGTFALAVKGPPGWSWNPDRVTVVVDHNGCNNNADINFRYTGFSLSGKVVGAVGGPSCAQKGKGPAGVTVSFLPEGPSDTPSSVLTSLGGDFKIVDLVPGEYQLLAHHPKLSVEVKGDPHITLGFGNVDVGEMFFVSGYMLEGSVASRGNPVLGVHVYLYSDDVTSIPCVQTTEILPIYGKSLCHSVSDANGKFSFNSLPCGKYKLVPFYKGENTIFDVSPSEIEVNINHENVLLPEPFKVTGFSVGGRVIDSKGAGVEGVQIFLNDLLKSVTDIGGYYKLDQVTSTHYTIRAQKSHYKFTALENFLVLPNIASLPDIVATEYSLCGLVIIDESTHNLKRQIALTHGPANFNAQTKWVDEKGSFCFEVPPGEYRLTPIITQAEQLSGLAFSTSYIDILVQGPVFDVVLTQSQVSVAGSVNCIVECDDHVSVSLSPITPGTQTPVAEKKQTTGLTAESNAFLFEKVLPGKYQLTVRHEPYYPVPGLSDAWCWKENKLEIEVGTVNLDNLLFVQKGFWMAVHSTHPAQASIVQPNGETLTSPIEKGWQYICARQPGIHKLQFVRPCVSFGMFPFKFDTSNPQPIELLGQKYLLSGKMYIQNAYDTDMKQLTDNIVVLVWRDDGSFADSNNRLRLATDEDGTTFLEYSHWAKLDEKLTFVPRDVRGINGYGRLDSSGQTQEFLFYPRERHVDVVVDGCQPEVPAFVGKPGMYIKGIVMPALPDVNISIQIDSEVSDGNLKKGDTIMSLVTENDGSYIAGPFHDDLKYAVLAAKSGYHCIALDSKNFECQKLGQIIVHIFPGEGSEKKLPPVLLSLSGDSGFRKNALSGSGEEYVFDGLFPGNFFLRPLLKEYSFSPASLAIDLESGAVVNLSFTASRISFSVLGTVTSLTGKPEEGISIEARSEKGYYEETVSDVEGRYRLRGLRPDTLYTVKVLLKDNASGLSRIERASPSSYAVQVGSNDTTAVDFVVFDRPLTTIITGSVEGAEADKWQQHLAVRVSASDEGAKVEQVIPLPISHFFEVQGLPRGKYAVQLFFDLSDRAYEFESKSVDVDLVQNPQIHVGALHFSVQEHHHKQDLASAPVFPVLIGLVCIVLAISMPKVLKEGQQWITSGSAFPATPNVQSQAKKEPNRKTVLRKRTY